MGGYFYVISRTEYETNSKKIPTDTFDLKNLYFKVKGALRIFFSPVFPIFSASMTLESHLQLSLMQKMKCDLEYRFLWSRIPQWFFSVFFSYSVHQITKENTLKSSLLLEKWNLTFKYRFSRSKMFRGILKLFFTYSKHQVLPKNITYFFLRKTKFYFMCFLQSFSWPVLKKIKIWPPFSKIKNKFAFLKFGPILLFLLNHLVKKLRFFLWNSKISGWRLFFVSNNYAMNNRMLRRSWVCATVRSRDRVCFFLHFFLYSSSFVSLLRHFYH